MNKQIVQTTQAPGAIGTYSQAVKVNNAGNTVYLSGQIGLDPATMELAHDIEAQARQVFDNLRAVAQAAGADLQNIVKLTIYLTDLGHFGQINTIMAEYFTEPYPARAALGVAALPKNAQIEVEGIMVLDN